MSSSNETDTVPCYLGIDVGTQGLTALLVECCAVQDETNTPSDNDGNNVDRERSLISPRVVAMGEESYGFVPDLPEGCYEQNPSDWETALVRALEQVTEHTTKHSLVVSVRAICVTGQMHGCVMIGKDGKSIGTARLWCDARNQEEADTLTELFGERVPKRLTAARYLWSLKHQPEASQNCVAITTPAGYIAHRLTSKEESSTPKLVLGVGEASGMFPVRGNAATGECEYRDDWIRVFDDHVQSAIVSSSSSSSETTTRSLADLLPGIRTAGDVRDHTEQGAVLLNPSVLDGWLSEVKSLFACSDKILVAPAEGDQPTALAASLIGEPGMISCSFGTSVVANMVGSRNTGSDSSSSSTAHLQAVDRFNAVNGQPISMVWLRNGTTFLNRMVESYGGDFASLMTQVVEAPTDCGGLLALPFLDDEPGSKVSRGGTAMIVGFDGQRENHQAGNVIKAAILSVMFNLLIGTQQVEAMEETKNDGESNTKKEIVLTGGLTKTPETGQILADVFDRPVRLLEASDEGGAWGAALLAKYYDDCEAQNQRRESERVPPRFDDWLGFLQTIQAKEQQSFVPRVEQVAVYSKMLAKYKKLLQLQPSLDQVMNGP
mmetsp:Transcript_14158/g.39610  ORF Transcript_14158/g.39610 Transcript_14158/m.39610 type:complete len:605 (+) Transcript_14158:233-2047(+)|eukprot:CAMPEP_0172373232 /NCGR_PEP_ID=MMETSP1060-20121228/50791_1 /TAXON_ID=37318 /ORGANISM="Pseudo-nitzschia pungens, Strain cf. cingulata" /LENGTH=604 /DNA_ID=CAMNT_0013099499 /DNA_START=204 /DNA_END=2018 /DNA_ORIENTATION=+